MATNAPATESTLLCGCLLVLFFPFLAIAQEEPRTPTPPEGLTHYLGREVARTMHWSAAGWLVRHKREREEAASTMRENLGLKPGMVVCDMGCGNGYHTLPMAEVVGEKGAVYGVDIQPEMITMLLERAEEAELGNIKAVIGDIDDPNLPADTFDLILLVDVYHEFSHPIEMLAGMRNSLKPDGAIVLVEYRAEDATVPIKPEHKMSRDQVMKEMLANQFKFQREFTELPWQHMMFFQRDDLEGDE